MNEFLQNLWQTQKPLVVGGFVFAVLTVVFAIAAAFDSTQITNVNRWIKPLKFGGSIAVYLLTLAVFLYYLKGYEKTSKLIAWSALFFMGGEMVLIVVQVLRGTTSHFNFTSPLNAAIFAAMGVMIAASTLITAYLAWLYFRADFDLPVAVVWGMRLGLIVFVFGSIEGGYMAAQIGHTVGAADGGSGLPLVNWSVTDGDLRVAHFLGIHALQTIPLAALVFQFFGKRLAQPSPVVWVIIFAVVYFCALTFVFVQYLSGNPIIRNS